MNSSLLHKEMSSSSLFIGDSDNKFFSHNIVALQQQDYFVYGQLCAMGILLGSSSPCFFAPSVVDYILHGELCKVSTKIEDVPNQKAKQKLQELSEIEDAEKFKQTASFDCSLRFKAGYNKPIVTIKDKDDMLHCISLHFTLVSSLAELDQFIEGLKLNGFLELVRKYPSKAHVLFQSCQENSPTADNMDELFSVDFSPKGSNRRISEESVYVNFSRYLEDVEGGQVQSSLVDINTDQVSEVTLTLADILQFVTGSTCIPAIGFAEVPTIQFIHDDSGRKLHASTCSNTLTLPVCDLLTDYSSFKQEMTSCILMSPGFGNV